MSRNKAKRLRNEAANFRKFHFKEWYKVHKMLDFCTKDIKNDICSNVR